MYLRPRCCYPPTNTKSVCIPASLFLYRKETTSMSSGLFPLNDSKVNSIDGTRNCHDVIKNIYLIADLYHLLYNDGELVE